VTKKKETTEEFMARLRSDPEWVARTQDRKKMFAEKALFLSKAEEPVVQDLRKAGVNVKSVWDLVNTSFHYDIAIPILLKHLPEPYLDRVRDSIARALAVPEAKDGWNVIVQEYLKAENDSEVKSGLACAINVLGAKDHIDEVIALIRDSRHGTSRMLLVEALRRSKNLRAKETLDDLIDDPEIGVEIQRIKRKSRKQP
jgi:hypothetical protein